MTFYQEAMNYNNLKINNTNNNKVGEGTRGKLHSVGRQSKGSWRLNEDEGPHLVLCMDWETRAQRLAVPGAGTHNKSVVALGPDTRVSPSASYGNSLLFARMHTTSSFLNPQPKDCKPLCHPHQKRRTWTCRLT